MMVCKYIIGDSRNITNILANQKTGKPNLIITSPPYYDVKNYGDCKKQIGFGQNYDEYLEDIVNIFQACYDLSSECATFWLIADTIKRNGIIMPLPFDINRKLCCKHSRTWQLKDVIVWNKKKNLPWNGRGKFKNKFEYVFFFVKNNRYRFNIDNIRDVYSIKKWWLTYPERYNPKGKAPSNIWEFIIPIRGWGNGYLNHLCPFPFPLVERIISICSRKNDLILDPFTGSGVVLAMANVMGRNSVGIDINKEYKNKFKEEVLIGANRYWEKREGELKERKRKLRKFARINGELRKNKLGSRISQLLGVKKLIRRGDILVVMSNRMEREKVDIIIITEREIDAKRVKQSKEIMNLPNEFKIGINWIIANWRKSSQLFQDRRLYIYNHENIHDYSSITNLKEIMGGEYKSNGFLSTIKLNIKSVDSALWEHEDGV